MPVWIAAALLAHAAPLCAQSSVEAAETPAETQATPAETQARTPAETQAKTSAETPAETPAETIVVTATRTTQAVGDTLASVTVITREDIERRQARNLQDLLRGQVGISVSNNGGPGKASVFVRGTEADHLLVMIDGMKVGSATLGTTAFQDIPLDQVERIEIVRGPRSSLYGSEAIGGVIQIFTRRGGGGYAPFMRISAGSNTTRSAGFGLSGGGADAWFNVSVNGLATDGINACDAVLDAGCFVDEPDADGYRNRGASLRAGHRFSTGTSVDFHWLWADGHSEFDGSFVNESESRTVAYGGRLRVEPAKNWQASVLLGRNVDRNANFRDGAFKTRFDTVRNIASVQNNFTVGDHALVTLGFDYQNVRVESSAAYPVTRRVSEGVFAHYQASLGAHALRLGLRLDDDDQFRRHSTGSFAWGYDFAAGPRLSISYGTAFKAPTFNELYFPGFGNPELEPESSRSIELGVDGDGTTGAWSLRLYRTTIDDLIGFDASFTPANIDSARILGMELELHTDALGWNVDLGATVLDAENRSTGDARGKRLPRRARYSLQIDLDREFGPLRAGALLRLEGQRFDDLANTRPLGGYATLDVRAEHDLTAAWRLQGRLANVLDKEYETSEFFNQPGRGLFITLRYQPSTDL